MFSLHVEEQIIFILSVVQTVVVQLDSRKCHLVLLNYFDIMLLCVWQQRRVPLQKCHSLHYFHATFALAVFRPAEARSNLFSLHQKRKTQKHWQRITEALQVSYCLTVKMPIRFHWRNAIEEPPEKLPVDGS